MDTPRFYEVKPNDANKLRAVVKLLEEHATFKNLSYAQLDAIKDVIQFVRDLPPLLDAAAPKQPPLLLPNVSTKELRAELHSRGYMSYKVAEES